MVECEPPRAFHRRAPALLAAALGLWCACRTTEDMQRDYAQTLRPAQLTSTSTPAEEADAGVPRPLRKLTLRAYADQDYQRQTLHWRERIEAQVEHANQVLEAQFGVHLVLKEIRSWDRTSASEGLGTSLDRLVALDPARDVDWVVGYVSSLAVFASNQEQLGMAGFFGPYLVLRGMASMGEVDALNATLDRLSDRERDDVTRERRVHKETAVFLHEWGHTLGTFHERSAEFLMSPYYDVRQSSFSPGSVEVIELALAHRDGKGTADRTAWAEGYRAAVQRFASTASNQATVEEALISADQLAHTGRHPSAAASASPAPAAAGTPAGPDTDLIRACDKTQDRPRASAEAVSLCRRAADVPDAPADVFLLLGRGLLAQKHLEEGVQALERAEQRLLKAAGPVASWAYLAHLYEMANSCSLAERAASHASTEVGMAQVLSDCARSRRTVALPKAAAGVPVEREFAYVEAVELAQHDVATARLPQARSRAAQLAERFPGSPGPLLILCLVDAKAGASSTETSCTAATAAAPEAFAPWLALGRLSRQQGHFAEARTRLERALALEASSGETWSLLAAVYLHLGEQVALAELKAHYRARFGIELRPAAPSAH